jgi:chromate reductase
MTSSHSYPIRLLGISGSLRRASNNTAVLHSLATLVAGKAELVVHPLNDIPLYDGDLDTQTLLKSTVSASRSTTQQSEI